MMQENNVVPKRPYRLFAYTASLLTIGIAGYFAFAGIIAPESVVAGGNIHAAVIYSAYVSVRSFVLLGALAWLLFRKSWQYLWIILLLNGLVQIGDAIIGVIQNDLVKIAGPVFIAMMLIIASMLVGPNKWKIGS